MSFPVEDEGQLRFSTSLCHLVVDSGFSFTHVLPVIDGRIYKPGVRRVDVGGKLLTNYLKDIVSFRQWNVMDDTPVINELKEALCYCSMEFGNDLKRYHADRRERKHWILPDYVRTFEGRLRDDNEEDDTIVADEEELTKANDDGQSVAAGDEEQALEMGVEMVTVPEVLFNPSDIGIHMGMSPRKLREMMTLPLRSVMNTADKTMALPSPLALRMEDCRVV
uniref:Actin-related protein 6 n=1 Tax=Hyaloperonospora arabidopsidis (strain Emoy2) TaxID=559515 RepID=M4B9Q6_HYAAE